MANEGDKGNDFYAVMGLNKECTESELRNAYKKLALKWHPDRCSALGNSKFEEEAKKKFQAIQQAYSVLSDANKRFMYDVGFYESDDEESGMGGFLNEMVTMMNQTKPNMQNGPLQSESRVELFSFLDSSDVRWKIESSGHYFGTHIFFRVSVSRENGEESFEELQQLFEDMFQADIGSAGSNSHTAAGCSTSSTYMTYSESSNSNKRNSTEMNFGKAEDSSDFDASYQNFCLGVDHLQDTKKGKGVPGGGDSSRHRYGRKQKISSGHDVSSNDCSGISAK